MGVLISFQDPAAPVDDTGTWTPLRTPVSGIAAQSGGDAIELQNIHPADLQNPPPEIDEIVKAVARGWAIPYWSALGLLEKMLLSLRTKGVPRAGASL